MNVKKCKLDLFRANTIVSMLFYSLWLLALQGEQIFRDDFDGDDLTNWGNPQFTGTATGWKACEENGRLYIYDITGPYSSNPPWAHVEFWRDIPPLSDFDLNMEFTWDSENDLNAIQTIHIGLYTANYQGIASGGYTDAWVQDYGELRGSVGSSSYKSQKQPLSGSALLNLKRVNGHTTVSLNNIVVVEGQTTEELQKIRLICSTGHYSGSAGTSFFGTETIDYIELRGIVTNTKPVADAGIDQVVHPGNTVCLDGRGSYDDNTPTEQLSFEWTFVEFPGNEAPELTDPISATPCFVATVAGNYEVKLVVTDDGNPPLSSDPDYVTVSSDNLPPVTIITPKIQVKALGQTTNMTGFAYDPNEDPIENVSWSLVSKPIGSLAELIENQTDPYQISLIPDLQGLYVVQFLANDGIGDSEPSEARVTAVPLLHYFEEKIASVIVIITELEPSQITARGNANALTNFLNQALLAAQNGELQEAIDKVTKTIVRTDGCIFRTSPDTKGPGRDWIVDCTVQEEIYTLLMDAISVLNE